MSKNNDNFRNISIWPTFDEITANIIPHLTANNIKGNYKNVDHYLDVQFRLLREDFLGPLRKGINEYVNNVRTGILSKEIEGIRVYEKIILKIVEKRVGNSKHTFNYFVYFGEKQRKAIDWKEQLIYGSLLCFSFNKFQTYCFGTVNSDEEPNNLEKSYLKIRFNVESMTDDLKNFTLKASNSTTKVYELSATMIESEAYFEAYRHNLLALQRFPSKDFRIRQYIIDANTHIAKPPYHESNSVYDLSHAIVSNNESNDYKSVSVYDSTQWPNAKVLGFDDSQYEAFKFALLKQFALIQGPPGTGKTYVGLKIVETLYRNKIKPILIVCYTNHALDQFMEQMLPFCQNMVRIGGRSKSEKLEPYIGTIYSGFRKDIIGMTTTGAAKWRLVLERIKPKIVVIEEASELLESHVITSLTMSTQHLILIGDHQQLRPKIANFSLEALHLDVSLFERMVDNEMPFIQLKVQHRMRPIISSLLVPLIYKELSDHQSVKTYENIRGVKKNMFFITHKNFESSDERSKSNIFEAKFIVRLCKHFLYQNYDSSKITILSMYLKQLSVINNLLKKDDIFEGIKATTVDDYQGEENEIILVSFVRSNAKNVIGFLKVSNRVNVALSRAKKGLYCIGNFESYANSCELWRNIRHKLISLDAIGSALELHCSNHSNKITRVSKANDFFKSPFGGCLKICKNKLKCGHSCPLKTCHGFSHILTNDSFLKSFLNCEQICFYSREEPKVLKFV